MLTYNVRDLKDDASSVAHVMRSCRPDVVCLQEVPRRLGAGRRVRRLARECGLRWSAGGRGSGGTAVLTAPRVEVLSSGVGRLAVAGPLTRTRGYSLVRLRGLTVVSVHLPLRETERLAHVAAVLDRLRDAGPCVVAGDLNELPDGPSWAALAALVADPGGCGPTYPARAPTRRIDAVLTTSGVAVTRLSVAGPTEQLWPQDLRAASDHLPVIADLAVWTLEVPAR